MQRSVNLFLVLLVLVHLAPAQEVINNTLLKADKLYIARDYEKAVVYYVKYLEKYPKDYFASRQAAICYNRLNDPNNAIDYWPVVVESSDATERDYFEYGKSLLANNRVPEAVKVFKFLSKSKDQSIANWGKAYMNPTMTRPDTVDCKITEVKGLNTEFSESCPVIFRDKLFYLQQPSKAARSFEARNKVQEQFLKVCVKKDSLSFLPSLLYEKLQALDLNGQFCFSPDGNWLYFSKPLSNKELYIKSEYAFFKYQLFQLKMNTLNNAVPEVIPFQYNKPEYDFMHPSISADGKYLYFASNKKGSMGGKDIYRCELKNNGWEAPVNLGPEINTAGNEVFPHAAADGSLYFSSDQRPGLGGLDIFLAKTSNDSGKLFEPANNVGDPINSRFDDFGFFEIKVGKKGYFSSNRKNNTDDDLYYFLIK